MADAILDTTVVLHLFRKYQPALTWFNTNNQYGITSITWMEVMQGASNKANQVRSKNLLSQFDLLYPLPADHLWAMTQLEKYHFSHHIPMNDCLIASVAYSRNMDLYTHNLKDMAPLVGGLAIRPYT